MQGLRREGRTGSAFKNLMEIALGAVPAVGARSRGAARYKTREPGRTLEDLVDY